MKELVVSLNNFYINNQVVSFIQVIVGVAIAYLPAFVINLTTYIKYGK